MPGTTETLALELAAALAPLEQRLATPQGAVSLFAEMGLPLPAPVSAAIASAPELPQIVTAVSTVAAELPTLVAAVDGGDSGAIGGSLGRLVPPAATAFSRLQALADRARAAFGGDLSSFGADVGDLIARLPERLVAWLVVISLEQRRQTLHAVLSLPGIVESVPVAGSSAQPGFVRRDLRLDRIPDLLSDPEALLRDVYRWGDPATPLDSQLLLLRLQRVIELFGFFASFDSGGPKLNALLFTLAPAAAGPPTALELSLLLGSLTGLDLPLLPAGEPLEARLRGAGGLELGAGVRIDPPATLTPLAPTGSVDGELTVSAGRVAPAGQPLLLLGQLDGTRVTASAIRAAAGAAFQAGSGGPQAELVVEAELDQGQLVVAFGGADGFLSSFLPGTSTLDVDLAARWTSAEGLTFRGGAALAITIPLAVALGPLRLDRLDLRLVPRPGTPPAIALEGRVAGAITLGPLSASAQGIGAGVDVLLRGGQSSGSPPEGAIDLGPVAVAFRFLPPTGLGLGIAAGPVTGGGFIRFEEETARYSGTFAVSVGEIGISALGLLDTHLPGGARGYALLVLLRGQFPPIQVGFGFALSSIGGLLALNRHIDVDTLRQRFATGAVARILAPEDPIRDAPILLADLAAVFPPTEGVIVVGPTLELSWVEIVRFDLGIFVELPPLRIVLLGSASAGIPNPVGGRPLLQIRLDMIGLLDLHKKVLEFDAVLVDSQLLEILELTGGAAFRMSWGDDPYVLLSVGGFHPGFSPAPLTFPPSLTRIAMTRGQPDDPIYLRFEGYFAVTTNTLQFGAAVELIINAGPNFNVRGFLGFDTLIRFIPFFFEITFHASVKVRWKGHTLGGVDIDGTITGPGPVTVHGKVCFEILFFDVCWEETFTIGSSAPPAISPVASAVAELAGELADPGNLSVDGGEDPWVALAPAPAGEVLPVVPAIGQLAWTQKRAPLDLLLERFEAAPLATPETVTATGARVTGDALDLFAPGSFADLSTGDALNRPAFERLAGGVKLGAAGVADGRHEIKDVTVQQIRIPHPPAPGFAFVAPGWMLRAVDARNGIVEPVGIVGTLSISAEPWSVVGARDGAPVAAGVTQAQAHQLARHRGAVAVAGADRVGAFAF